MTCGFLYCLLARRVDKRGCYYFKEGGRQSHASCSGTPIGVLSATVCACPVMWLRAFVFSVLFLCVHEIVHKSKIHIVIQYTLVVHRTLDTPSQKIHFSMK